MSQNYERVSLPRYLTIAVDVAERIAAGQLQVGTRLRGRSVLSSEYQVSPETIRRSMSLLEDKGVVSVVAGSGIRVESKERAQNFVLGFKEDKMVAGLRRQLDSLVEQERLLQEQIRNLTAQLIDLYKYRRGDLVTPVEVDVPSDSHIVGKSIADCDFWHNTGATIIAVMHKGELILSPGPYYVFSEDDRLLLVGDEHVIERLNSYLLGLLNT
ncbi:MAG: TrkA C-terminal domain-containing protein [Saccharofermentanales bacterium]|jgi:K+/H+ antiporter YhaU regulatory subunit KhtT